MAISDHKLTDEERKTLGVAALAVRPQMSAKNLKEWFDQLACRIATLHNDTIDDLAKVDDWEKEEAGRDKSEQARLEHEESRILAELTRRTSEQVRVGAERTRQDIETGYVKRCEDAAKRCEGAAAGGDFVSNTLFDSYRNATQEALDAALALACMPYEEQDEMPELDSPHETVSAGTWVNAGAGWNTFVFPKAFQRIPYVCVCAMDFDGIVCVKNVQRDRLLYCLYQSKPLSREDFRITEETIYLGTNARATNVLTSMELTPPVRTTDRKITLHWIALDGGTDGTDTD